MNFNYKIILKTISFILLFEGVAMIPSWLAAFKYHETEVMWPLILLSLVSISFGIFFFKKLRDYNRKLTSREGFIIALLSWIIVSMLGSIPYLISIEGYSLADCFFESVAGWTTTSSYVIPSCSMTKSLMLWKATTNWLGGMGILVLTISIFPALGVGGKNIVSSELTGPELTKMSARISDTAKIAYGIYLIMTLIELILLNLGDMGFFEALLNTLSTVSTSGIFDTRGEIILNFSPYTKTVITLFSILASINFKVYFLMYIGQFSRAFKDIEVKSYLLILLICSLICGGALWYSGTYTNIFNALGAATVQVVSFGSTSGFSVSNISTWPTICQAVLIFLMIMGGCSLSTSGSLKAIRVMISFKLIVRGIYKRIHPRAIKPVLLGGNPVKASTATAVTVYIMLFFTMYAGGILLLSLENKDMTTTLTAALSAISNNGSGLGEISDGNYGVFSDFGKIISAILMLLGRLELYAVAVLFSRSFWKPDQVR